MDLVVRGGIVVTPEQTAVTDVGVADGVIVQIGGTMSGDLEIDARGRYVLPGGVDAHVHLTPPGTEPGSWRWVDDFDSGTAAALAGGVTTVGNMSFPRRGEQMLAGLERDLADAAAHSRADHFQHPVLMDPDAEGLDQIDELAATGHPSVKVFMSFQRFERRVGDYLAALRRAAAAGSTVLMHCEDAAVIGCCCEVLRGRGDLAPRFYPESRPVEAERAATERAMAFGAATGATVYVVHLSSAAALESCRRARAAGVAVHVETRPIYMQFTRERFDDPDGAKYAGAPPLRDAADRDAMWEGAADGAIDTVCTDHAPWTLADKLDPALDATELRQGMAELETTLPVLWSTGVRTGRLSVERLVSLLSTAPARLFGMYPTKGAIAVGSDADLVVLDPDDTRTVDGSTMQSSAGWSPYDGWALTGWPQVVTSRGEIVVADRRVVARPGRGRLVERRRAEPRSR